METERLSRKDSLETFSNRRHHDVLFSINGHQYRFDVYPRYFQNGRSDVKVHRQVSWNNIGWNCTFNFEYHHLVISRQNETKVDVDILSIWNLCKLVWNWSFSTSHIIGKDCLL